MKKFKRLLSLVLCGAILLTSTAFATKLHSSDSDNTTGIPQTNEDVMPQIPQAMEVNDGLDIAGKQTLFIPERQAWVANTTQILEEAYGEHVEAVYETDTTVVFEFEDPTQDNFEFGTNYIMKEVYMKPEAQAYSASNATKVSYVYGFAEGMYPNGTFDAGSKSGLWSSVMNATITVAGLKPQLSVAAVVLSLFGIGTSYFAQSQKVQIDNLVQYYILNKVGMVKDTMTGMWVPLAYVGMRKEFRHFYIFEDKNGYLLEVDRDITVPNNFVNPTNADETLTKAHFFEDSWIMGKALSVFENDGRTFYDVFVIIDGFFQDTYPSA